MRRRNKKGFTLVEIMIVVAIIALLAAIAIPNLLRAKVAANEALAQSTLRALSTAAETYGTGYNGNYPANITALTNANPAYLNTDYCGTCSTTSPCSGYDFVCTSMTASGYTFTANFVGTGGTTNFTITTGGILR